MCGLYFFVADVNRVPVFSNLIYTLEVPETTAAGSILYVITVTDSTVYTSTGNIDITWTSADKYKFSLAVSGLSKSNVQLHRHYTAVMSSCVDVTVSRHTHAPLTSLGNMVEKRVTPPRGIQMCKGQEQMRCPTVQWTGWLSNQQSFDYHRVTPNGLSSSQTVSRV